MSTYLYCCTLSALESTKKVQKFHEIMTVIILLVNSLFTTTTEKKGIEISKKNCTLLSPWYYWIIFYHSLPKYVFTTKWNMLAKIEEQYSNFFYLFCKKRNDFQMAKIHERQKLILYQLYLYFRICDLPMKVIRFLINRKWIKNTCMYQHR